MQKFINGNWYAPLSYLEKLKSTIECGYIDQTSSAGDWSGYLLKKIGNRYKLFLFDQINTSLRLGFTLFVSNSAIATFKEIPEIETIFNQITNYNSYYKNH